MRLCIFTSALLAMGLCAAAPAQQTLNDGNQLSYGTVYGGKLSYDSSGTLKTPCTDSKIAIGSCYSLSFSSNPKSNLDTNHLDSPRQRNEFRTPWAVAGEKHTYSWKQYLYSSTGTGSTFFHLMQVFDNNSGNPVVTLDARNGKVQMESQTLCGSGCPSIPISSYTDRTTVHTMVITYGPQGSMTYTVTDASTKRTLISFSVKGSLGSSKTAVKFGTYRAAFSGMTAVLAGVGDYTVQ
ncbi:hypothetical protein BD626DRAFT_402951 [Schizophyllum amplum]|uniref:Uncharacterized protein n=1 Tax=Schizophyllum amplum TaxID=97359 RepID=A0A550CED7_9AGAR|nr:hypothetical protein BD626DRAFT_402951 [Auriculariopsis ampla]